MSSRHRSSVFSRGLSAILLLVFGLTLSFAQTYRGGIGGNVVDESGAAIPGVKIKATNADTDITQETISSSAGEYSFHALPLGVYTVTASLNGFQTMRVNRVTVTAGAVYNLPIKLTVAQTATTVEVTAAGLTLDTSTPTQTTNIPNRAVQDIPLNGRDFTQMLGLAPGFAGYSLGGFGSVNGTRGNQVNWQIDGSDNNDLWHNIPAVNQGGVENIAGIVYPIDAVEEFSLQTGANAEGGRNPGGTANVVTKSGTNTLHGTAYYYERNQALASQSPFITPDTSYLSDQPLTNIQWGASLGGPVWKDKTFYFATFEKQMFNIGTGNRRYQPNQAFQSLAKDLLAKYNVPINPATNNLLGVLWPSAALAGTTTSLYAPNSPEHGYSYNGVVKLDHSINNNQHISLRGYMGQGNQIAPVCGGCVIDYYFEVAPIHVYNYEVAHSWTLSPAISNLFTFGFNYFNQVFSDQKTGFNVSSLGFVTNSPYTQAPNISISGFEPIGQTPPEGRNDMTSVFNDALAWTIGKHQYKFTGEFRRGSVNEFYQRHSVGSFTFTGEVGPWCAADSSGPDCNNSYASLADFLAGYYAKANIARGDAERTVSINNFAISAQDQWQILPTLNVNYGLRYEYMGPMHNDKKDLSVFRPELGAAGGLAFQGNQIGSVYPQDWNNFSPRVGFSYSPNKFSGYVLRGGVGIFFDTPNANPFLDNRPGNSAPNGLEGNPGGPNPVYTLQRNGDGQKNAIVYGQDIFNGQQQTCDAETQCGIFTVSPKFRSSYNINFNLQVERSLGSHGMLQLGYVGSQGRKLLSLRNINQPLLGGGPRPYVSSFPQYGDINQIESIGTSNYNSLQMVFRTTNWKGITSQFSYTWGHNLDEMTQYRGGLPQDSYNFKGDYGNSDFDTRNTFVGFVNFDVPAFSGPKLLSHGWSLNGVFSFKGGQPMTIYNNDDTSGTDEYTQRVNLVGDPFKGVSHKITSDGYVQWLNPDAFAEPAAGTWGTMRRNSIFGPGFGDVDFSVIKATELSIHDKPVKVQFRAEMYNLFNRINFASPSCSQLCNAYFGARGFGQTGSTIGAGNYSPGLGPGEPFNTQLAMKLIF